jgi:choline-sulfatase
MASKRPNILIIMADFMGALSLPAYGNTIARTPGISKIAEHSVIFQNAYCNYPLCAPSRASMLSGLLSSEIGVFDNGAEFSSSIPTLAHYLRQLDYRCELSGKMHFVGPDQLHGYDERLTSDIVPADFGWMPPWRKDEDSGWPSLEPIREAGIVKRTLGMDFDDEVCFKTVRRLYDFARDPDLRPFFLTASFIEPHEPFKISREYWELYSDSDIGLPSVPMRASSDWDAHSARLYALMGLDAEILSETEIVRARHAYYSMLSNVDSKIAEVFAALQETGLDDNTIVLITADHGSMIGERGMWGILNFYEWAMRVPFIVYAPNRIAPRIVNQNVSLVDLLPTLLDIATDGDGVPGLVAPIEGDSVLPLALGAADDGDRTVFAELFAEGCIAPCVMLKRGSLKYIHCEADAPQLFDLSSDPSELSNLAAEPAYAEAVDSFQLELREKWDLAGWQREAEKSRQRRALIFETYEKRNPPVWDYAVDNDPWRFYQRSFREPWQDTENKAILK